MTELECLKIENARLRADAQAAVALVVERAADACVALADQVSNAALTGLPEQARLRESMEAAFTKASHIIRALAPADALGAVEALRDERDRFEAALGRACLVGGTTYLVERAEKAEAERADEWRRRRDADASRDAAKAACETMRAERDAALARVEALRQERDNLADNLELEKALTDGAHRRARNAEAELAQARADAQAANGVWQANLRLQAELAAAQQREAGDAAQSFDEADWFWRTMDPDDCGDSPEEAINRAMVGQFCVCEIASSFSGPTRYGFVAPVLDPESDDEEFVHFATQQEAIDAAKARAALSNNGRGK